MPLPFPAGWRVHYTLRRVNRNLPLLLTSAEAHDRTTDAARALHERILKASHMGRHDRRVPGPQPGNALQQCKKRTDKWASHNAHPQSIFVRCLGTDGPSAAPGRKPDMTAREGSRSPATAGSARFVHTNAPVGAANETSGPQMLHTSCSLLHHALPVRLLLPAAVASRRLRGLGVQGARNQGTHTELFTSPQYLAAPCGVVRSSRR